MSGGRVPLAKSFPPIATPASRLIVLGSMPGVASLEAGRYYAHPRNHFWPIMAVLIGFDAGASYESRCLALRSSGVALWDVLSECRRAGSLDSAIERSSEMANDFATLFQECPAIGWVVFNGQKAEQAFRRHVRPALPEAIGERLGFVRAPSTSPAHANRTFDEKLIAWRAAFKSLKTKRMSSRR